MSESLFNNVAGLQAKTTHRCFPLNTFFQNTSSGWNFPIRFLSFSFSFICNSMPCSGCSALYGFNLDQKKDRNTESVNKFEPNFFY